MTLLLRRTPASPYSRPAAPARGARPAFPGVAIPTAEQAYALSVAHGATEPRVRAGRGTLIKPYRAGHDSPEGLRAMARIAGMLQGAIAAGLTSLMVECHDDGFRSDDLFNAAQLLRGRLYGYVVSGKVTGSRRGYMHVRW